MCAISDVLDLPIYVQKVVLDELLKRIVIDCFDKILFKLKMSRITHKLRFVLFPLHSRDGKENDYIVKNIEIASFQHFNIL